MSTKVTEKDYKEFFAEENKNEIVRLKSKIENLQHRLEDATAPVETPPAPDGPPSLNFKISLILAIRPDFEYYFHAARRYDGIPNKEFSFVVLKRADKTGRFDITCQTYVADVPLLSDVLSTYGPGRYRLLLKYWDDNKIGKGKRVKGAFTVTYFDHTLIDPTGTNSPVEFTGDLKGTIFDLIAAVGELTRQARAMLEVTGAAIDLHKKTLGAYPHERGEGAPPRE